MDDHFTGHEGLSMGSKGTWLAALRQARPLFFQIWTCGDISFIGGRFSAHKHMFLANLLQMLLHVLNDSMLGGKWIEATGTGRIKSSKRAA